MGKNRNNEPPKGVSDARSRGPSLASSPLDPGLERLRRWQVGRFRWEPTRVLVVDDDALFRSGVCSLLREMGDIILVGEAANGAEAVDLASKLRPDVILMDADPPGPSVLSATSRIVQENPHVGVILIIAAEDPAVVLEGLQAGASGYFVRSSGPMTLRRRIKTTHKGELVLSPIVAKTLMQRLQRHPEQHVENPPRKTLTERQRQVLQLTADGLATKEISVKLLLSEKTIRNHFNNIFAKLGANDRTQAIVRGIRMGFISLPDDVDE